MSEFWASRLVLFTYWYRTSDKLIRYKFCKTSKLGNPKKKMNLC